MVDIILHFFSTQHAIFCRMSFDDLDVTLFCDMTSALRLAPLRAATNESMGLHVHIGRYPGFFSVEEVAAILKVAVSFWFGRCGNLGWNMGESSSTIDNYVYGN